ncbi:MAG: endonuclease MutS2 [Spirochaetales bacterium]|nr:MAG: endonuclease MutS2 [Spirochaetales bacterium]
MTVISAFSLPYRKDREIGMDSHSQDLLEFETIREQLAHYCRSEEGPAECKRQKVCADAGEGGKILDFAVQYRRILETHPTLPDLVFPAVRHLLAHVSKEGTVLDVPELFDLYRFFSSAERLRSWIAASLPAVDEGSRRTDPSPESVWQYSSSLPRLPGLLKELKKMLNQDGTINDSLPELSSIRTSIQRTNESLSQLAQSYLHRHDFQAWWQSDVPTQKEGRVVLPLKSDYRGRITGIIHEVSASGKTLFMEPFDIVDKNNQLKNLENDYRQAVLKVLKNAARCVRENLEEAEETVRRILYLDTIHARARYALAHRCYRAEVTEKGIELLQARHPLLGNKAVPIDVSLPPDMKALIISGPNAGGKTGVLKTLGLLVLMNQFGMEIPASSGSSLPWFGDIHIDIGDEQSLSQSLSTFSAHISRISGILKSCGPASLVLLDELGTGTDAAEGSAIAMAVLDECMARGAVTLVTTHQSLLKNYGFTKQGVGNASLEFDMETLTPTYRLLQGIPGESRAIDIAGTVGMPARVIGAARFYLGRKEQNLSDIIRDLLALKTRIAAELAELEHKEENLLEEKLKFEKLSESLRVREADLKREGLQELNAFLSGSRKSLENLIREIRENPVTPETTKQVKEFIREVEEKAEGLAEEEAEEEIELYDAPGLKPGMEVYLASTRTKGFLVRKNRDNTWVVATDAMKISVAPAELKIAAARKPAEKKPAVIYNLDKTSPKHVLDVRGLRLDEALKLVEQQVDQAVLSELREFSIIHGMGEGILGRGIHQYLKEQKTVRDYYFAHPDDGGYGKTIVVINS